MTRPRVFLIFLIAAATGCIAVVCCWHAGRSPLHTLTARWGLATWGRPFYSEHYEVDSTATDAQTRDQMAAVESLYRAYASFFSTSIGSDQQHARLTLVLYKDRQEFKAHNISYPWAEAFYSRPNCYAYVSAGEPNPYHWMVHEATHQLNDQVAHFKLAKWTSEGLATYFGTSRIDAQGLHPGQVDDRTYPIWWLSQQHLSGDIARDIAEDRLIPLRAIVSGVGGPDIDTHVNLYYIEYWSLTHFLFHYRDGLYADRYRKLIVEGGSLAGFERIVGPIDRIQGEWYGYLRQQIAARAAAGVH